MKIAKPRQLLTTVVRAGTITVLSMSLRAMTALSMLTTVMVAKDAKMVILLPSLALNVRRNLLLALSIILLAFLVS